MGTSDKRETNQQMGMAIKWENKIDYPLHTSTFKPTVHLSATLRMLIRAGSSVCSPHTFQKWSNTWLQGRKSFSTEGWIARKAWKGFKGKPLTITSPCYRPSDSLDHLITAAPALLTKHGLLVGISGSPTKRPRLQTLCFKGQSKHDCKQKPENPPAASISSLANYQTFTDKWNQSTSRAKLWKISAAGKSSTAILPWFSVPWWWWGRAVALCCPLHL